MPLPSTNMTFVCSEKREPRLVIFEGKPSQVQLWNTWPQTSVVENDHSLYVRLKLSIGCTHVQSNGISGTVHIVSRARMTSCLAVVKSIYDVNSACLIFMLFTCCLFSASEGNIEKHQRVTSLFLSFVLFFLYVS